MESADMRGLEPLGSKIPCRCKSCRRHFFIFMEKKEKTWKKVLVKAIVVVMVILTIVLVAAYIFNMFSGEGKLTGFFQEWAEKNTVLAVVLFLTLSPIINLIPGISSMFFITLANLMFNDQTTVGMLKAFGLCAASITLTSSLMFLIGRYGGKKLVDWIIGKDVSEKTKKLLTAGGKALLPAAYLLPFFPDDTIALVVGMTNMSFLYNLVCTLIFRNIGALTICVLGTDFFDYSQFTWWMWITIIVAAIIVFSIFAFISYRYYKYLRAKEEGPIYYLTKGLLNKKKSKK